VASGAEVSLKILVLGGTKFLGRAIADAALAAGHELTLFNRGETNPELFPEAEKLRGNRDGDLSALGGRRWDAVIDPSGFLPRIVRASVELLRDSGHYTFVSSCSVYPSFAEPVTESSPVARVEDESTEDVEKHYGALKALCEEVVEELFSGRALHVRAGLIVGPHDPTGRFTYWPQRIARGDEVLVPGTPERPVQLIDVRDLGEWIVRSAETGLSGAFNVTSPPFPMRELLACCEGAAAFTHVDERWLVERGVGPWVELPLWIPTYDRDWRCFMQTDVSKAVAAELTFRPLEQTARGALEHAEVVEGVGLTPEREAQLLKEWRSRPT